MALEFLTRKPDEEFEEFYCRLRAGLKKLSPKDLDLLTWKMKQPGVSYQEAIDQIETMYLIGQGQYSPRRGEQKMGVNHAAERSK